MEANQTYKYTKPEGSTGILKVLRIDDRGLWLSYYEAGHWLDSSTMIPRECAERFWKINKVEAVADTKPESGQLIKDFYKATGVPFPEPEAHAIKITEAVVWNNHTSPDKLVKDMARQEAIDAMTTHLKEKGSATTSDLARVLGKPAAATFSLLKATGWPSKKSLLGIVWELPTV